MINSCYRSDLHGDVFETITIAFPGLPHISDGEVSGVFPPQVNPIRVSIVALTVPKPPEVGFSTVPFCIRVLVFIKGGEFLFVVCSHRITYRTEQKLSLQTLFHYSTLLAFHFTVHLTCTSIDETTKMELVALSLRFYRERRIPSVNQCSIKVLQVHLQFIFPLTRELVDVF